MVGKIGCKPYKTLPYHPQSNGSAERMVQTVKMWLKVCSQQKDRIEVFLSMLLLSYRSISQAGRLESLSALMGRKIKASLTMSYSTNIKKNVIQNEQRVKYRKGRIYHAKRSQCSYNEQRKGEQYVSPYRSNKALGRIWRTKWGTNLFNSLH